MNRNRETRATGDLLYDFIARHAILFLILVLAFVCVAAIVCGQHKHFWYDEIFTIIVASQPTLHKFAQAMPVESSPPMNTLLVRLCIHLFGLSEFSVRLPAMLGFCASLIGLFVFVRRECGPVFGLLAVTIMVAEPVWTYSFEARAPALLLAFLLLALVSWQSATRSADATPARPRTLALAGMAMGIVGCIFSHHIGLVEIGAPLLFGETVRVYRRRRCDWPLIAAGVLPALAALTFTLPMAHRTKAAVLAFLPETTSHRFLDDWTFAKVTLPAVISYRLIALLVLVVGVSWFLSRSRPGDARKTLLGGGYRIPAHIISAALGTMLLIPITWLAMISQHGWYFGRYGIGTVVGIAMITCFLLARYRGGGSLLVVCLIALCSVWFVQGFAKERHRLAQGSPVEHIAYEDKSTLPMVISDPLAYPATWWYAPSPVKERMVYLTSRPGTRRSAFMLLEACLDGEKSLFAAPLEDYGSFVAAHDHFLLDEEPVNRDLKESLEADGFIATPLREEHDGSEMYDMQRGPAAPGAN